MHLLKPVSTSVSYICNMKKYILTNLALCLLFIIACRENVPMNEIHLKIGQIHIIQLEQSAGTGYQWELFNNHTEVVQVAMDARNSKKDSLVVGGKQNLEVKLTGKKKGNSKLVLQLKRSWENQAIEQKEYTIIVN